MFNETSISNPSLEEIELAIEECDSLGRDDFLRCESLLETTDKGMVDLYSRGSLRRFNIVMKTVGGEARVDDESNQVIREAFPRMSEARVLQLSRYCSQGW